MVGLVLISHGQLAEELLRSAEMILGPLPLAQALALGRGDDPAYLTEQLRKVVDAVGGDGDGVLILTDMFGGTPSNIALSCLERGRVDILTAMNLPMVLKFSSYRARVSLDKLCALVRESSQQAIVQLSSLAEGLERK